MRSEPKAPKGFRQKAHISPAALINSQCYRRFKLQKNDDFPKIAVQFTCRGDGSWKANNESTGRLAGSEE